MGGPQVIPAFNEAIVGMKVGGIRRLIVEPELGYPDGDFRKAGPQPGTFAVGAPRGLATLLCPSQKSVPAKYVPPPVKSVTSPRHTRGWATLLAWKTLLAWDTLLAGTESHLWLALVTLLAGAGSQFFGWRWVTLLAGAGSHFGGRWVTILAGGGQACWSAWLASCWQCG